MQLTQLKILQAGYCRHYEAIAIAGGSWEKIVFPATFALIEHPSLGFFLFDTGLSNRVYDITRRRSFSPIEKLIPYHINSLESAVSQIEDLGIKASEVKGIIISHFHSDHIAGLNDFPNAKFYCHANAFEKLSRKSSFQRKINGFFNELIPVDFESRMIAIEQLPTVALPLELAPFSVGYDMLGDKSLILISLPGHALGHVGLFTMNQDNVPVFFVADACWLSQSYQCLKGPNLIGKLVASSQREYYKTLTQLHHLYTNNTDIRIVPSHCEDMFQKMNLNHVASKI